MMAALAARQLFVELDAAPRLLEHVDDRVTQTMPAWIERPIPTPPPSWMLTQAAPEAVLTSALSRGQSAIASDPSSIDSVSR